MVISNKDTNPKARQMPQKILLIIHFFQHHRQHIRQVLGNASPGPKCIAAFCRAAIRRRRRLQRRASPCASRPVIIPANTSPETGGGKPRRRVGVNGNAAFRFSDDWVSLPLSTMTALLCFAASRVRTGREPSMVNRRSNSPSCGVSTVAKPELRQTAAWDWVGKRLMASAS